MKQKSDLDKYEEKTLKEWKKQKAKEKAKGIAIEFLCGMLNSFSALGCVVNPISKPVYLTPEDHFPTKKRF